VCVAGARAAAEKRMGDALAAVEAWKRKCSTAEASIAALDQRLLQADGVRNSLEERVGAAEVEVRPAPHTPHGPGVLGAVLGGGWERSVLVFRMSVGSPPLSPTHTRT
jgi:hypothetical protein